jgi:hypothetical protein
MKLSAQPPDDPTVVEAGVPSVLKSRPEPLGPSPGNNASMRKSFNVSRAWQFPAAHADSFISRRFLRTRVQIPVELSLSRLDGSPFDAGIGVVRDLSFSGLCLSDIFLSNGRLLAAYFAVELRPAMEPSGLPLIGGRILRTHTSGLPCFGIEFLRPEVGAERRLRTAR